MLNLSQGQELYQGRVLKMDISGPRFLLHQLQALAEWGTVSTSPRGFQLNLQGLRLGASGAGLCREAQGCSFDPLSHLGSAEARGYGGEGRRQRGHAPYGDV